MNRWEGGGAPGGILRTPAASASRRPQLLMFGYSCKLFRDDERALFIDQGLHLIPCMGDDSLKIDRYDARAALGAKELTAAEGCGTARLGWERLTSAEQQAERLCDEERYRALYCDEDEEEMYREEELKRMHMSQNTSYGQVEFNYELDETNNDSSIPEKVDTPAEDDEPFIPTDSFMIPEGMPLPETKKLNTIIEKTASFIASHGTQMEILLKAKQSGNPQFDFLSIECPLYPYYCFMLTAIKEGRFKPLNEESKEEKSEEDDHYLHPSLAPMSVESAPSIPSISYKPSADCAYSMLVNEIKGTTDQNKSKSNEGGEAADPSLAPPGTESHPAMTEEEYYNSLNANYGNSAEYMQMYSPHAYYSTYGSMYNVTEISKAPVLYRDTTESMMANIDQNMSAGSGNIHGMEERSMENYDLAMNSPKVESKKASIGLKLTHYSDSEDDSDSSANASGSKQNQLLKIPPPNQQTIIDKMASYVARNGDDFEQIVRMKGDPRFSFLDSTHEFNAYYKHKRMFYERMNKKQIINSDDDETQMKTEQLFGDDSNEFSKQEDNKKVIAPVSFSIKKMKEPEAILPRPALPYESSEDDGENENSEKHERIEKQEKVEKQPVEPLPEALPIREPKLHLIDPTKLDYKPKQFTQLIYQIQPTSKEHPIPSLPIPTSMPNFSHTRKENEKKDYVSHTKKESEKRDYSSHTRKETDKKDYSYTRKDNEKKDYYTEKSQLMNNKEQDEYKRRKRKRKVRNEDDIITSDIITIDEEIDSKSAAEFIDLTSECNDDNIDNTKNTSVQLERKKRAAAFLSSLKKVVPATPVEQHNTLASAMVKTLNTLQTKSEESESKRRKRDSSNSRKSKKRKSDGKHNREKYYGDESEYYIEGDGWKHSSRDPYKSRHSHDRHSRKYKRKKSRDSRSPDYHKHSHKRSSHKYPRKDSPRSKSRRSPSKDNTITDELLKAKKEAEMKTSQKNDELVASLKQLVRETRRELITKEPIKMAVDIFADDIPNKKVPTISRRASEDEWEKDSNDEKRALKDDSSSSSSSDDS